MKKNLAPAAWLVFGGGLLAYEIYAVTNSIPGDTLSEAVWNYGQHPLIALGIGIVLGHFYWQRKRKP